MDQSNDGDECLIAQLLRDRDEQGIRLLLEEYGGRVAGYLGRRFPSFDDHDIHDVLVDAVMAVSESFDPERGPLAAWFLLLAHQRAVGMLRARPHLKTRSFSPEWDVAADQVSPLGRLVTQEHWEEVEAAMASLSRLERAVLTADIEEGEAVNATLLARQQGTSEGSIYAARRRGRRKLLDKLHGIQDD